VILVFVGAKFVAQGFGVQVPIVASLLVILVAIAPPCRVAGFDVFEYRLAYELPGALEVQPQRLLQRDPEKPQPL
jgi:hypothetical protein